MNHFLLFDSPCVLHHLLLPPCISIVFQQPVRQSTDANGLCVRVSHTPTTSDKAAVFDASGMISALKYGGKIQIVVHT